MPDFETTLDLTTATVDGRAVVVAVEVAVEFSPGWYTPAKLSGHPDSWAPEEGESPEITRVTRLDTGADVTRAITHAETDRLIDMAWSYQCSHQDDYRYDDDPRDYDDANYDYAY